MNKTDPYKILAKYVDSNSITYDFLVKHGQQVAKKALEISKLNPEKSIDLDFIHQSAILHDIGIIKVNSPKFGCHGDLPYMCHGIAGRKILESENLPLHALICERHIGMGIDLENIKNSDLPLPSRDMTPKSIAEKIICLADKFFSKDETYEKPFNQIVQHYYQFGIREIKKLIQLCFDLNYPIPFKYLNFADPLPAMILSGEKTTTWRIADDKDLQPGDLVKFTQKQTNNFATAVIYQTKHTTFGQLNEDDWNGHEKFASQQEMHETYSIYYHVKVGDDTKVKVIKFALL